jgi:hypothetical protein
MTETPSAIKTELQNFWMPCVAKFRQQAAMRNEVSPALAHCQTSRSPLLALERTGESRHCPRRFVDQE